MQIKHERETSNQSTTSDSNQKNCRNSKRWAITIIGLTLSSAAINVHAQYFDSPLALSDIVNSDGTGGFAINGSFSGNGLAGNSVSAAGDINGDGLDDLIISAARSEFNADSSGTTYVVFGTDQGFPAAIELSALDGANGFAIYGIGSFDRAGSSISAAGDVNGDGLDDLIIGAGSASANGSASGASYVLFGSDQSFPAEIELSALDGTNGFTLNGAAALDFAGESVSAAGDVNGDGLDDILIGAYRADPNGEASGTSYVVFGAVRFPASIELSALDGTSGFAINGATESDFSGNSVSTAGDVNGDGLDDILIGAYEAAPNGERSGSSYVVFGSDQSFASTIELSALDGVSGFAINGVSEFDLAGDSVSAAGDVNGDGYDDVLIGAYGAAASYVVFGSDQSFPAAIELSALNGVSGFTLIGSPEDRTGWSVSDAGDINSDGIDDLIIGADLALNQRGVSYVIFGSEQSFPASIELSTLDGVTGFAINGIDPLSYSGRSVSYAGDVNGDGRDDIIIGAPGTNVDGASSSGASYVVFGRSEPGEPNVELSIKDKTVNETDGEITVTLELSAASRNEVTATVNTRRDSALNGHDYYGWTKTARFAPGALNAELTVTIIDDFLVEGDESFRLNISSAVGANIRDGLARVDIIDNDTEVLPVISVLNGRVSEGDSHNILLRLSHATDREVTVWVSTQRDSAVNGQDYYGVNQLARIPSGETTASVSVQTIDDTAVEGDEIFFHQVYRATGATLGNRKASTTIIDDDYR